MPGLSNFGPACLLNALHLRVSYRKSDLAIWKENFLIGTAENPSEFFITETLPWQRITLTSCDDRLLGPANIATRVSIGTGTRPRNLMN